MKCQKWICKEQNKRQILNGVMKQFQDFKFELKQLLFRNKKHLIQKHYLL